LKVKVEVGLKFKITFFNTTFGFVHILPKFGFKQPSIILSAAAKKKKLNVKLFSTVFPNQFITNNIT